MLKKVTGLLNYVGVGKQGTSDTKGSSQGKEENKAASAKLAHHKRIGSIAQPSTTSSSDNGGSKFEEVKRDIMERKFAERKIDKIKSIIEDGDTVDLEALRQQAWKGMPIGAQASLRAEVWKLLLEYYPEDRQL